MTVLHFTSSWLVLKHRDYDVYKTRINSGMLLKMKARLQVMAGRSMW